MNGFPEKVLLATEGLEHTALAAGRLSLSRRRAMRRRVLAKGETMKRLHPRPSLPLPLHSCLWRFKHANWGNVWCVSATSLSVTDPVIAFLGNENQVPKFEGG